MNAPIRPKYVSSRPLAAILSPAAQEAHRKALLAETVSVQLRLETISDPFECEGSITMLLDLTLDGDICGAAVEVYDGCFEQVPYRVALAMLAEVGQAQLAEMARDARQSDPEYRGDKLADDDVEVSW